MSANGDLLVATKVRKEFGGLVASNDIDFTIPRGGIVSLIGPNGAGKTTFFNQLTGVYHPNSGSILFDGTEVAGLPPHRIVELGIGRTFQNIRLFQQMTAVENVLVGMHCAAAGAASSARSSGRRASSARRRPQTSAPGSCSATAAFPAATTSDPARCRTATSGGWRWRARSPPIRSCCSSTSRQRA